MGKGKKSSQERELFSRLRTTWVRNPRTYIKESERIYNRKKSKKELHRLVNEGRDGVFFRGFCPSENAA